MKKTAAALVLSSLLIAAVIPGIKATFSFLTDYKSLANPVTPGCNETKITEDYPDSEPQNPKNNPVYPKTVQITAPKIEGINVDCYVRARILYSNSDIGNAVVLRGQDSSWIKAPDGYYYYKLRLSEGQTTAPLFREAALDSSKIPDNVSRYVEDFSITVYEESVQAGTSTDYKDAWSCFVPAEA